MLLLPGDLFIMRSYSPEITVGGGQVLDPAPPRRRRRSAQALELLQSLEGGEDGERIRLLTQESLLTGITLDELVVRSGLSQKRTEAALTGLLTKGLVVQMVRVGEESGTLPDMLESIAEFYDDEVKTATEQLTSSIEPILIVGIGIIIGGMVVALYLPIFTIYGEIANTGG